MYRRRIRKAPLARNKEEKCVTKWCKNRKAARVSYCRMADGSRKGYAGFLSVCWKCHAKKLKERHPATYVLNAIRQRAKARKIPFDITLEQFKKFCAETGYLEKRGRKAGSATIDRIDHDKGYHIWNIQIMTFLENCTNGHVVPGRETKQNERKPETYDYEHPVTDPPGEPTGLGPEPASPVSDNEPF